MSLLFTKVLSWLRSAGSFVISNPQKLANDMHLRKTMYPSGLPLDMYRHIFVSDFSNVRVPPHILSGGQSAHDPLPPPTTVQSSYDAATTDASTQANSTMNSIDALTNFLQALLPWANPPPQGVEEEVAHADRNLGDKYMSIHV